jgi:hypothetical protein
MKQNHFSIRRIILIFFVCFISSSIMAQKVNLDTLNIDQLNLYKDKAVAMKNTGRALTLTGVGVFATGFVIGIVLMNTPGSGPPEDPHGPLLAGFYVICLGGLVGIPCTLVGIPLWAVGGSRKAKAELTLQKFNIAPENSIALGLGITLRF